MANRMKGFKRGDGSMPGRRAKNETVIYKMAAIAAGALLVALLLVKCGGGGGSGSNSTDAPQGEVPSVAAEVAIGTIREIGTVSRHPAILKRDCGFSALFQGQSIWLFGDTLMETPNTDNLNMISNSLSCTFDIDAGDGLAGFAAKVDEVGAPAVFFPLTEEEKLFNEKHAGKYCEEEPCNTSWHIWPGTIIVDEVKDWAYVFYRKVLVDSGIPNFHHVGHSVAVWKDVRESAERPFFDRVELYPTLLFGEKGDRGFGSASVVMGREAFVYGCELGEDLMSKPCYLARVPLEDILERDAWMFYVGHGGWSSDFLQSEEIFAGNDMMSVFFNAYLNRFVAIYSENLGSTAMLRTAPHPEGPWSEPIEIFSIDAPHNLNGWVYDFLAHPEYSQDDGKVIYITYSIKFDDMYSELRLVAVELLLPQ